MATSFLPSGNLDEQPAGGGDDWFMEDNDDEPLNLNEDEIDEVSKSRVWVEETADNLLSEHADDEMDDDELNDMLEKAGKLASMMRSMSGSGLDELDNMTATPSVVEGGDDHENSSLALNIAMSFDSNGSPRRSSILGDPPAKKSNGDPPSVHSEFQPSGGAPMSPPNAISSSFMAADVSSVGSASKTTIASVRSRRSRNPLETTPVPSLDVNRAMGEMIAQGSNDSSDAQQTPDLVDTPSSSVPSTGETSFSLDTLNKGGPPFIPPHLDVDHDEEDDDDDATSSAEGTDETTPTAAASSSMMPKFSATPQPPTPTFQPGRAAGTPRSQFEKISTASEGDDDYVPLVDYTKNTPAKPRSSPLKTGVDSSLSYSQSLREIRRKKAQGGVLSKLKIMLPLFVGLAFVWKFNSSNTTMTTTTTTTTEEDLSAPSQDQWTLGRDLFHLSYDTALDPLSGLGVELDESCVSSSTIIEHYSYDITTMADYLSYEIQLKDLREELQAAIAAAKAQEEEEKKRLEEEEKTKFDYSKCKKPLSKMRFPECRQMK